MTQRSEILIRTIDKIHDDIFQNLQLLKRGDVVVIMPNEWGWSSIELFNPDWRILCVNLTIDQIKRLTIREQDMYQEACHEDDSAKNIRACCIDLSKISIDDFSDYLNDAQRTVAKYYIPDSFDFSSVIIDKPRK